MTPEQLQVPLTEHQAASLLNAVRDQCTGPGIDWLRQLLFERDRLRAENTDLRARLLTAAGDDLCRLSQEEIKALGVGAIPIPPKEEFLASCERFHAQIAGEVGVNHNCLTLAQLVAENAAKDERAEKQLEAMNSLGNRISELFNENAALRAAAKPLDEYLREDLISFLKSITDLRAVGYNERHCEEVGVDQSGCTKDQYANAGDELERRAKKMLERLRQMRTTETTAAVKPLAWSREAPTCECYCWTRGVVPYSKGPMLVRIFRPLWTDPQRKDLRWRFLDRSGGEDESYDLTHGGEWCPLPQPQEPNDEPE